MPSSTYVANVNCLLIYWHCDLVLAGRVSDKMAAVVCRCRVLMLWLPICSSLKYPKVLFSTAKTYRIYPSIVLMFHRERTMSAIHVLGVGCWQVRPSYRNHRHFDGVCDYCWNVQYWVKSSSRVFQSGLSVTDDCFPSCLAGVRLKRYDVTLMLDIMFSY